MFMSFWARCQVHMHLSVNQVSGNTKMNNSWRTQAYEASVKQKTERELAEVMQALAERIREQDEQGE